jgi:hypothetical protein
VVTHRHPLKDLIQRLLVSTFIVIGGLASAIWLWPEEIADAEFGEFTSGLVLRVAGAVSAALVSLGVLVGVWTA